MLCKNSKLILANSDSIDLPRLVPSFSSKGFPFIKKNGISQVSWVLENTGPTIRDSFLISAYDMHFKYLKNPHMFFGNKELIIIDSGGYELSTSYDSTESVQYPYTPNTGYDIKGYEEVLLNIDQKLPIIITNFDYTPKGIPIRDQIINAQSLFNKFPHFTHDFIIKPSLNKKYLDTDEIISHILKMQRFHIIGLTEKELGGNLLDRMIKIAEIRHALDEKSLMIPIHIWGGLDPLVSILYFIVGADIFDGISWLKYGYNSGYAITRDSYTAAELGIHIPWSNADALRLGNNISYLYNLQIDMQRFAKSGCKDYSIFGETEHIVKRAFQVASTKLSFLKE